MKIFRTHDDTLYLWDLKQWISSNGNDVYNRKIGISWKIKKRRKLRSYHISWNTWECDCCGPITSVTLEKGGRKFVLDNHFGPGKMGFNDL